MSYINLNSISFFNRKSFFKKNNDLEQWFSTLEGWRSTKENNAQFGGPFNTFIIRIRGNFLLLIGYLGQSTTIGFDTLVINILYFNQTIN
jgi:hypothetical protein